MDSPGQDRLAALTPGPAGTLGPASPGRPAPADAPARPVAGHGKRPGGRLPRLRAVARHRFTGHSILLLAYLAAGVLVTWPRASYLTGLLPASRDTASYVWGLYWMAHQVSHLGNPWTTAGMAAPVGIQLGFDTLMPLPGLLLTPVTLAFGPSASLNLLVIIVPGLLCYVMYRAARLWLSSQAGAITAGAFYGLSSMLAQQDWYHVNIAAGALFVPMALEASVRLRRSPGRRHAIILGAVLGAAVLVNQESALLAAIVAVLVVLPWLVRQRSLAALGWAGLAVVAGLAVGSPQLLAMLSQVVSGGAGIPAHSLAVYYEHYGVGLPGMFTPTPRVADFGLGPLAGPFLHGRDNEGMPMFGTVLSVMALLGVAARWRRGSTWKLAGLWLGCAALALGVSLWVGKHQYIPFTMMWNGQPMSAVMPYTWFVRIPGLAGFREADRLALLGIAPAALLAGAAADWLRYHARPLIAVVLVLGALEAGYPGSPSTGVISTAWPSLDSQIAADASDSVVVDVPFGLRGGIPDYGSRFFPQALVMATADGHPRAISYTSWVPEPTIRRIDAHPFYHYLDRAQHAVHVSAAHEAAARQDARRLGIGWLIVWKRNNSVTAFILPFVRATGFTFAYRDRNFLVYKRAGS